MLMQITILSMMQRLRWKCCYLWACSLHYDSTCDWINPRGDCGVKMSCWALMFPWLVQLSMHCVFCTCPVQVPIKYSAQNKLHGSLIIFYHGEQVNNKYCYAATLRGPRCTVCQLHFINSTN